MSDLGDRMNTIKTLLATAYSTRIVTRDFMPPENRDRADLLKGIYTILSSDEGGYPNYRGREGMDGRQNLIIIGQFELEAATLKSGGTHLIDDAEFAMVDEIKSFLRTRPPVIAQLFMKGFRQSRQLDAPYGWVVIDAEFIQ
ncbi:MAG TPA: hypothetical protein VK149_03490 [Sideroxyarcus sp.]|nr:hypothetical protein [Sideroxyarcus sp.]